MLVLNRIVWRLQSTDETDAKQIKISVSALWPRYCEPVLSIGLYIFIYKINQT